VVTRLAPPPAPPAFQTKLGLIKESGGRPVSRVSAEQLAAQGQRQRPVVNVRPAVPEGGKVLLAPKREMVETRPVRPVTVPQGRTLSTGPKPFTGAPAGRTDREPLPGPSAFPRPDGGPAINGQEKQLDRRPPEPGKTLPRPDGGPATRVDRPADRVQPEKRDVQPRPEVKPEARPETKPEPRTAPRNVDRPVEQGQPERRLVRPEIKPEARPEPQPQIKPQDRPAAPPAPLRVEPKPQPAQRVEKPQPAPKAEKPAKPEEPRKDKDKEKDKKDR
jgi:hypothetical protein